MPAVVVPVAQYLVSYNSVIFDGATTYTKAITSRAHYDEAGRTIVWVEYQITICSVIVADPGKTTDAAMNELRHQLYSPGGDFVYHSRGIGDFDINIGRMQDARWGPRPLSLNITPWGDANVFEIEWTVEVCVPECDAAKFEGHVAEVNFSYTDSYKDGFLTRRLSGHVIIPQTRNGQGNRRLQHSADEYREKVQPRVPAGFRPLEMTFRLSLDKCRLDWECPFEEMGDEIPPPGVIRIDATMETQNSTPSQFFLFQYTLSASYDLARGTPGRVAHAHFLKLAEDRQEQTKKRAALDVDPLDPKRLRRSVFVSNWRVREPRIYDKVRQASFTISWLVTFRLKGFLANAFWTPVPDSNWQQWQAGTAAIFGCRGNPENTGLEFDPGNDDLILDLCFQDVRRPNAKLKGRNHLPDRRAGRVTAEPEDDGDFLQFEQSFRYEAEPDTYVHKPLPVFTSTLKSRGATGNLESSLRTPNLIAADQSVFNPPGDASVDIDTASVIGERCQASYSIVHEGRAVRLGRPIACPVVVRIGQIAVVPANRPGDGFKTMRVMAMGGALEVAVWRMRYHVPARPGTTGGAGNPTFPTGAEEPVFGGPGSPWDPEMQAQNDRWNSLAAGGRH